MSIEEDQLFYVCSSVCCSRTPAIEPSLCGTCLLMKYDSREKVLVQLSAIRCLYCSFSPTQSDLDRSANGADFKTFSLEVVHFFSCHSQSLYHLLIGYLESRDQFISFAASKALIYVMLYSGVEAHVIEDIFIKLQAHIDTHGTLHKLLQLLYYYIIFKHFHTSCK
ncbi:hypothetical protein GBAR_LOCUS12562 [Geodia barretti]|uniref:Uncharacterized protein n=1 Tax=Geodia barretti TaxID=519541 RepID=A0AA35S1W4_GEOBA|nr:hypothetical protein GBAR_LOCUS12562 [Geodia barretti]